MQSMSEADSKWNTFTQQQQQQKRLKLSEFLVEHSVENKQSVMLL